MWQRRRTAAGPSHASGLHAGLAACAQLDGVASSRRWPSLLVRHYTEYWAGFRALLNHRVLALLLSPDSLWLGLSTIHWYLPPPLGFSGASSVRARGSTPPRRVALAPATRSSPTELRSPGHALLIKKLSHTPPLASPTGTPPRCT
jgi:hypothetical protein